MCNGTLNFGTTNCNDKKVPEHVDEKEIPTLTTLSNVEEKASNGTMSQRNDTSDFMNQSQSQSLTTTQLALIFVGSLLLWFFVELYQYMSTAIVAKKETIQHRRRITTVNRPIFFTQLPSACLLDKDSVHLEAKQLYE